MLQQLREGLSASVQRIELIKSQTLAALSDVEEQLAALPEKLRESAKGLIAGLAEQRQRVNDLRLTIAFVGPAKAGKSTSINAILGVTLSPSDTFPCTVMPTTLRHSPNRASPRLIMKASAIDFFVNSIEEVRKNAAEIEKQCKLTDPEKNYLELIKQNDAPLPREVSADYEDLHELGRKLAFMNHFCRLYARAKAAGVLTGDNPLLELIRDSAWPVIELELELLRDVHTDGVFEIIDTPGRDETTLIPEIKGAVTAAMEASAAVVGVINIQTAMTDSMRQVKTELSSALKYEQPVFLLANKIDGLSGAKKKGKELKRLEEVIGAEFLDEDYDENSERRVFGVSASIELTCATMKRQLKLNKDNYWNAIKKLPDLVDEDGDFKEDAAVDGYCMSDLFDLIFLMQHRYGTDWPERLQSKLEGEDSDYNLEQFDIDLKSTAKLSKFEPFRDKLMKELAPRAGQKVLTDQIGVVLRSLQRIFVEMDRWVNLTLLGDDAFRLQQTKLEGLLNNLTEAADTEIPQVRDAHLAEVDEKMDTACRELTFELQKKVDKQMADICAQGIEGFQLSDPPSEYDIKNNKYLEQVRGKQYWECTERQSFQLQMRLRDKMGEATGEPLEMWVTSLTRDLGGSSSALVEALKAAMRKSAATATGIDDVSSLMDIDPDEIKLPSKILRLPDEQMGRTNDVLEKRALWYTLWMVKADVKVGTAFVLPVDEVESNFRKAIEKCAKQASDEVRAQYKTCLTKIADSLQEVFKRRCQTAKNDLDEVVAERAGSQEKKALVVSVAKSRILCEGLHTDLSILHHYAQSGSDISGMKIKRSLTTNMYRKMQSFGGSGASAVKGLRQDESNALQPTPPTAPPPAHPRPR